MAQADQPIAPQTPAEDQAETAATMSLGDHLEALRKRLISGLIGIGIASLATMCYGRDIVAWLCEPLFVAQRELGLPQQTINLSVAGGFAIYVKVSLLAGLVIGIPWATYQLWKFVAPGLRKNEQRAFRVVVPYSSLMTVLSVLFS
jgi:sec-independent protein translocase protein TatC